MNSMKRIIYAIFATVALIGCTADLEDQTVSVKKSSVSDKILNASEGAEPGVILVRFNAVAESRLAECATRSGATRTGISGVDAVLDSVEGFAVEPIFVVTDKNREKVYEAGLHLWYELRFDNESNIDNVATELAKVAEVERVQFSRNAYGIRRPKNGNKKQAQSLTRISSPKPSTPFNDPYFSFQWGLDNKGVGSTVGTWNDIENLPDPNVESDVNAIPAWNLCKGDPSIVVAVLDEGVMYSHEDLRDNMWVNGVELTGRRDVDDDGNGYVDDIYGYNFTNDTADISWNVKTDRGSDCGHGTHVAGIISAVNNNMLGISSIAGGSGNQDGVRIMSAQILTGGASTSERRIAKAMQYAADNGAHIMQCSWGIISGEADDPDAKYAPKSDSRYRYDYSVEADAIDYFIENGGSEDGPIDGGLAIFAAGNDEAGLPGYPSAYEPCISVASMGPGLHPTYYTNYGKGTDIIAPGGDSFYINGAILSTVPKEYCEVATQLVHYDMMEGTSMACPMVSGVAALGLSYAKQLGKRYTADEFRSILLSATNDIEPYLTGGIYYRDDYYNRERYLDYTRFKNNLGAGYIDAYKLLLQIDGTPYTTVKAGADYEIDLSPYFGDGVANAQFVGVEIADEDKERVGFGDSEYSAGKLKVNCSKCGIATLKVTLLVGGGSLDDSSRPFPTKVTKTFVVMVRSSVASNGGWL